MVRPLSNGRRNLGSLRNPGLHPDLNLPSRGLTGFLTAQLVLRETRGENIFVTAAVRDRGSELRGWEARNQPRGQAPGAGVWVSPACSQASAHGLTRTHACTHGHTPELPGCHGREESLDVTPVSRCGLVGQREHPQGGRKTEVTEASGADGECP